MPQAVARLSFHDIIASRCPAVRLASRSPGRQNPSAPVIAVFRLWPSGSVAKVVNAMTVLTMALEAPEGVEGVEGVSLAAGIECLTSLE